MSWLEASGHTLLVAIAASVVATLFCRGLALRLGVVDKPNPIVPQHRRPVAYLGGLAIGLALAAAWAEAIWRAAPAASAAQATQAGDVRGLLLSALAFLVLGLIDDLWRLAPAPKLALQGVAALAGVAAGLRLPLSGIEVVDGTLAALWIVTVVNAFNFTDVCDGLVAGIAVLSLLVGAAMVPAGLSTVALAAAGATLGFLLFNRPPASIFLGDAGSHLLGFLVAALGLEIAAGSASLIGRSRMVLLAAVPLFELVFITAVRLRKGLPWWKGSPDHFSLRLQAGGLGRGQVDAMGWLASALAAGLALLLPSLPPSVAAVAWIGVLAAALVAARLLLRWEVGG